MSRLIPGLALQVWLVLWFLSTIGSTSQGATVWEVLPGVVLLVAVAIAPVRERRHLLLAVFLNAVVAAVIAGSRYALYQDPHVEMEPSKTLVGQVASIVGVSSWFMVALVQAVAFSIGSRWRKGRGANVVHNERWDSEDHT